MSLVAELKRSKSPIRKLITDSFPLVATAGTRGPAGREAATALGFDELLSLDLAVPPPLPSAEWRPFAGTAGTAFDFRIRMILAPFHVETTTAVAGLTFLRQFGRAFQQATLHLEDALVTSQEYMESGNEDLQDKASVVMAWAESIYRSGVAALAGNLGRMLYDATSGDDLIAQVPESVLEDLRNLRVGSSEQIQSWRSQIDNGVDVVDNPEFAGSWDVGGADADWLIGRTLVECKTTKRNLSRPDIRETLLQALGYTLLDYWNDWDIQEIGVWWPRRAAYKSWHLDELLGGDAHKQMPRLQKEFQRGLRKF